MFHQFHQAHNFSIHGGQWNNIAGDQNVTYNHNHDPIFHLWSLIRDLKATHDTETYALRGCHPKTRESIRKYLVGRANDPTHPPLCWLSGSAGAGKTAIAQSVAKECQQPRTLISSFFFSRNDAKRNEPSCLFLSIAYGLAVSIPELRVAIGKIIQADPAVLHHALDIQFQELIMKPCRQLAAKRKWKRKWENMPRLIIIDGLDECQDSKVQKRLLEIITQAFTTYKWFPLRFLICSRPEPSIHETFDSFPNKSIMDPVRLDDSFQTRLDIETYLLDNLTRIRDEARVRGLYPPHDWPGSIIYRLSDKASGHFAYASTVVRFADDEYAFPWERVDVVLGLVPNPTSESPFLDLDQLYLEILSRSPDRKRLLDILGTFFVLPEFFRDPYYKYPPLLEEINGLLDLRPGELQLILRGMHAVLDIPTVGNASTEIKIHHASFTDFLDDKSRSGDYYINREYYRLLVISIYFSRLNKQLSIHRSSPELVFQDNWFLKEIASQWEEWLKGIEKPTDEFLRILGTFDWAALLTASVRYMLTQSTSKSWSYNDRTRTAFYILRVIEIIIKWLKKFPTEERVPNVINCLNQFLSHGFHISLPFPLSLSQAVSIWDTIAKWVGLGELATVILPRKFDPTMLSRRLKRHQPLILSSVIDPFNIVDWCDCLCSHQDQKTPVAFRECSYGVYYVPIHMFYSPLLTFLFDLSSSGVEGAMDTILLLARFRYEWLQRAGPMPELLPHLRATIIPIMNNWRTNVDTICSFLSWFKSFPEEYAPETQALMRTMADEIEKKNHPFRDFRPHFRWTGSELVYVGWGESEQLANRGGWGEILSI